jgi:hypothetical protein
LLILNFPGPTTLLVSSKQLIHDQPAHASQDETLRKTNEQLIDDLAKAAGYGDDSYAKALVRGQIIYHDARGDSARPAAMMFSEATGVNVSGGRLGRDHTLGDVPNCYVRDEIMRYIHHAIPEGKRREVRSAVFDGLLPEECEEYAAILIKEEEEEDAEEEHIALSETYEHPHAVTTRLSAARNVRLQAEALQRIDETIDLSPCPEECGVGKKQASEGNPKSVLDPLQEEVMLREQAVRLPDQIDRTPDQVRAMIKLFINSEEWTLDQFRLALGYKRSTFSRDQIIRLLDPVQPHGGSAGVAYQLAWEFFKRVCCWP